MISRFTFFPAAVKRLNSSCLLQHLYHESKCLRGLILSNTNKNWNFNQFNDKKLFFPLLQSRIKRLQNTTYPRSIQLFNTQNPLKYELYLWVSCCFRTLTGLTFVWIPSGLVSISRFRLKYSELKFPQTPLPITSPMSCESSCFDVKSDCFLITCQEISQCLLNIFI